MATGTSSFYNRIWVQWKMKDNVYRRNNEELKKALESMRECNKNIANKLREERKKYQELYVKYLKLERKLMKCGNL